MPELICKILHIGKTTYYKYLKEGYPIVTFLHSLSRDELLELLDSGRIKRLGHTEHYRSFNFRLYAKICDALNSVEIEIFDYFIQRFYESSSYKVETIKYALTAFMLSHNIEYQEKQIELIQYHRQLVDPENNEKDFWDYKETSAEAGEAIAPIIACIHSLSSEELAFWIDARMAEDYAEDYVI